MLPFPLPSWMHLYPHMGHLAHRLLIAGPLHGREADVSKHSQLVTYQGLPFLRSLLPCPPFSLSAQSSGITCYTTSTVPSNCRTRLRLAKNGAVFKALALPLLQSRPQTPWRAASG